MKTYFQVIEELQKSNITPRKGDFHEFEGLRLEDEFAQFIDSAQEFLSRDDLDFDISPARVYYTNIRDINACAYTENGYNLIEIWMGSIIHIYDMYTSKEPRFDDPAFQFYGTFTRQAGITPSHFLYQMTTHFFLYHETGHLIQKIGEGGGSANLEFMEYECTGDEIHVQHMKELDADWFACAQLAYHVKRFSQQGGPEDGPIVPEALYAGAALTLAALYIYFIDRAQNHSELYYDKHCHPHPMVRIAYCVNFLLGNIQGNITGDEIQQQEMLNHAIRISEHLMKEPDTNIVKDFSLNLTDHLDKIEHYINTIIENTLSYPNLSTHKLDPPALE
ncbi:hypothetical protein A4H97_00030 [Niastella yeongjuensis]|uniref:Uncharacterized protein n=1 Tax=Niastella yeongjuensis TaxID=354355 RepID=A0A1V9EW70_9BACT|nr:hypothetical protein [Niastella yeongjuensis]OQP50272.1 hypothetical protein A4H97_00030 [Niastella yeongjuensis]SEN41692.1 hypothetical protein SAMN05660816_00945 [Niastella yeongjuensis]